MPIRSTRHPRRRPGAPAAALLLLASLTLPLHHPALAADQPPVTIPADQPDTAPRALDMIDRAVAFLRAQQDPATGGWAVNPNGPNFPAISALVLRGMVANNTVDQNDPAVVRGVRFVLSHRQPDGGIYDRLLPNYNTAIVLSLLGTLSDPAARAAIGPAQDFLRTLQFGEDARVYEGMGESARPVDQDHPFYGGVGYGRHGRPDLSNTVWFLEGLHASGVEPTDPAFQRAVIFLQRLQMDDAVNDRPYADGSDQGGFIYATSINKDRVGVGQSFAGEIAESLSGPPGLAARITLAPDADGKPAPLTRENALADLAAAVQASGEPALSPADDFLLLLGPTADHLSAAVFEVRTALRDADRLRDILARGFPGAVIDEPRPVPAWKGVSRLRAYGSMTYSGFKSYIYADLPRDDARVLAALRWIGRHYTLAENPGLGTDGLYYYYVTFARALAAWGRPTIETTDADGAIAHRDWASDIIARLAELQRPDGSFKPVDDRWMEDNPVLITAYTLIALQDARAAR
jgi:hypothetical protein